MYASDQHVYDDINFSATIEADNEEDKIIYIDKNQSE